MRPIVDGLAEDYGEQLVFKYIDANQGDGPAIMRQHRIPGHPTTLIFDSSGQEIERFVGPRPREPVETALQAALNS